MPTYRVVDVRPETKSEIQMTARSPEKAAQDALDLTLIRSGLPRNLVCRVYWSDPESAQLNMIRLYSRLQTAH